MSGDIQHASVRIQTPPPPGADRLQMLFQWSRTQIGGPSQSLRIAGFTQPLPSPGFVVTLRIPQDREGFLAAWNNQAAGIEIPYVGEPPLLVAHVWLGPNEAEIDEHAELEQWLKCRRRFAVYDAAHAFFLELDEKTLVPFLRNPANSDVRDLSSRQLYSRLYSRARVGDADALDDHAIQLCRGLSDMMRAAFVTHFEDDMDRIGSAMDRFAAGWLREYCEPNDARLRDFATVGGDADSANIFMFAEFALAMDEAKYPTHGTSWLAYLNHFVRMQDIYMARYGENPPRRFKDYRAPSPILKGSLREIQSIYDKVGDDVEKLKCRMRTNLRVVFGMEPKDCDT